MQKILILSVPRLRADLKRMPPDAIAHKGVGQCAFDLHLARRGAVNPCVSLYDYVYFDADGQKHERPVSMAVNHAIEAIDDAHGVNGQLTAAQVLDVIAAL